MTHQYFSALIINYHSYFDTWFVFLSSDESESRFWMVCKTYWPLWLFICCFICNTKNTNFVYTAIIMNDASLFFSKIFEDISPWKFCRSWTSILQKNQWVSCSYGTRCYYLQSLFTVIMQHSFVYLAIHGTSLFSSKIFEDSLAWKTALFATQKIPSNLYGSNLFRIDSGGPTRNYCWSFCNSFRCRWCSKRNP